jgi:ACS family hexuronate transporter-like MFS transporter
MANMINAGLGTSVFAPVGVIFPLLGSTVYLNDVRHFTAAQRATALTLLCAISAGSGIVGGWLVSSVIRRGRRVGKARKAVMLACAIVMPFTGLGVIAPSGQTAVLLFAAGLAAHQAWMANLFTTPSDVFPKQAVGVTNGFGVCIGAVGGALFSGLIPGHVIPILGYVPVLLTMSCFYLIARMIVHTLMGNLEPIAGFEIRD